MCREPGAPGDHPAPRHSHCREREREVTQRTKLKIRTITNSQNYIRLFIPDTFIHAFEDYTIIKIYHNEIVVRDIIAINN